MGRDYFEEHIKDSGLAFLKSNAEIRKGIEDIVNFLIKWYEQTSKHTVKNKPFRIEVK